MSKTIADDVTRDTGFPRRVIFNAKVSRNTTGPGTFNLCRNVPMCRVGRWKHAAEEDGRANGPEVNPRGQGPRGYGSAARRMPAFEARDAGGVTPGKYR